MRGMTSFREESENPQKKNEGASASSKALQVSQQAQQVRHRDEGRKRKKTTLKRGNGGSPRGGEKTG